MWGVDDGAAEFDDGDFVRAAAGEDSGLIELAILAESDIDADFGMAGGERGRYREDEDGFGERRVGEAQEMAAHARGYGVNEQHGSSDAGERRPRHVPVLLDETLAALDLKPGEVFADLTAGLGGHASRAARAIAPGGVMILNDVDSTTLGQAESRVRQETVDVEVVAIQGNFARCGEAIASKGLRVDAVLADLGFSSDQMDDGARGFSFMREGPLDMRMDPTLSITAKDLVASLPEREIERILREYGEEPMARRIARKLAVERAHGPIEKTTQLAEIVRAAVGHLGGGSGGKIHPATRTFQALRIAVNDELGVLDALLSAVTRGSRKAGSGSSTEVAWLQPGARVAVITFHSLEDRMVKRAFQEWEAAGLWVAHDPAVVTPSEAEVEINPRSRSAKLRSVRLVG